MKNFIKRLFLCLMIIPCAVMVVACKNNNNSNSDGNNNTPANPPTSGPAVTLSSFSTEVVDSELESKFNESTNTFTIEYGDAMPSIEDFAITATYSDGTTQSVTGIKVVCPVEHYQNAMVVRDALYEFEIVRDDSSAEVIVEFFVKIVKKKVAIPTLKEDQSFVYNRTVQTLLFEGFDNSIMNIANNSKIDAGDYVAEVSLKDSANYEWASSDDLTFDWTIEQAELELLSVSGDFDYDGTLKTAVVNYGTYDANIFSVSNNAKTDAGDYKAVIEIIDNNYKWKDLQSNVIELDWSIAKAEIDALSVSGTYIYNGVLQTANIDYKAYDEDIFEVSDDKKTDAGDYKVSIEIVNDNYKWSNSAEDTILVDWHIERKNVSNAELPTIVGEYVYEGETLNVEFDEKFDDTFMRVDGGAVNAVGTHKVKIYLDDNHKFADGSLESAGYYELDWIVVEPEPEIIVVDLSGYDISDWIGTFNTKVSAEDKDRLKTIGLEGLPEYVNVTYKHMNDGDEVTSANLVDVGTYITTAVITLDDAYSETHRLPTADDVDFIPTISNARYESIVIKENAIEISFTWKIYTFVRDLTDWYSWVGESEYSVGDIDALPFVELNKFKEHFEFDYIYFKYDSDLGEYIKLNSVPIEMGKYKVVAEVVAKGTDNGTDTVIPDFEFEIV